MCRKWTVLWVGRITLAAIGCVAPLDLMAHGPGGCGASKAERSHRPGGTVSQADASQLQPRHGGIVKRTAWNYFEIVFLPQETQIYVYDSYRQPISVRNVQGHIEMNVHSTAKQYTFPLEYALGGQSRQEYLRAQVDVTRVRDSDMVVTFDLKQIPQDFQTTARFSQDFQVARPSLPVSVAGLEPADSQMVLRQRVCPVNNVPLADHGELTKVIVGTEIFVCCTGCVSEVRAHPDYFLRKMRLIWSSGQASATDGGRYKE